MVLVPLFVALVAVIHQYAADMRKTFSLLALCLAVGYLLVSQVFLCLAPVFSARTGPEGVRSLFSDQLPRSSCPTAVATAGDRGRKSD